MTAAAGLTSRSPAPVPRLSGAAPQALNPDGLLAEMPAPPPSRTPRLLRRLQVGAGLALLLLGTAACWVVTLLSTDLAGVPGLADQYARLGDVHSALVDANATARLGVIAQDGSPSAQADQVGRDLGTAAGLLVDAAKARPQDAEALVTISSDLVAYGALLRAADARDDTTASRYLAQACLLYTSRNSAARAGNVSGEPLWSGAVSYTHLKRMEMQPWLQPMQERIRPD